MYITFINIPTHITTNCVFTDCLIHLLEALGTLSITSTELTQFIKLLKADTDGQQVGAGSMFLSWSFESINAPRLIAQYVFCLMVLSVWDLVKG